MDLSCYNFGILQGLDSFYQFHPSLKFRENDKNILHEYPIDEL
jgi:hypothetical protein